MTFKRIVLDFDGVIHSYTSRWSGPLHIPDPPVEGFIEWLRMVQDAGFVVAIQSTRSHKEGGIEAMQSWLFDQFPLDWPRLNRLEWPTEKVPAVLYIDDRGFHFNGAFPSLDWLKAFRTWNRP